MHRLRNGFVINTNTSMIRMKLTNGDLEIRCTMDGDIGYSALVFESITLTLLA